MKKRIVCLLMAAALLFGMAPAAWAAVGLSNFKKVNPYAAGQFADVPAGEWYAGSVQSVYEYGLVKGSSATTYNPNGNITLAETVALAARVHSIYHGGTGQFVQGTPWYQVYVNYAVSAGIITETYDYGKAATRAQFAKILASSVPAEALAVKNTVEDNQIPDVKITDPWGSAVYRLYRAGILAGSDAKGTFQPASNIRRSEVAAILERIILPAKRVSITLAAKRVTMYSYDGLVVQALESQVAYYKSIGWSTEPQEMIPEATTVSKLSYGKSKTVQEYSKGILVLSGYGEVEPDTSFTARTVYIKRGFDSIDYNAFPVSLAKSVERIEISDTVTSMGNWAFENCPLKRLGIPASVTSLEKYALLYTTFDYYEGLVIYCEPGSAAEALALKEGLSYVYATPVYYPDGRTCMVTPVERKIYLENGWYASPVRRLYAADGRTILIAEEQVAAYENVGWHADKSQVYSKMYALDGRTILVPNGKVKDYQAVCWYLYPDYLCALIDQKIKTDGYSAALAYADELLKGIDKKDSLYQVIVDKKTSIQGSYSVMYALDGRTIEIANAQIATYQKVGWYLYPDYLCALADQKVNKEGYAAAVDYVEDLMDDIPWLQREGDLYQKLMNKKMSLCDRWRASVKQPVIIFGYSMGHNSIGTPEVTITFRNLTRVDITAFEVGFTCIDAYGKVTTDWPTLYNGNFVGYMEDDVLYAGEKASFTWTLYSNERTASVRNLHMVRMAFADGTIWKN